MELKDIVVYLGVGIGLVTWNMNGKSIDNTLPYHTQTQISQTTQISPINYHSPSQQEERKDQKPINNYNPREGIIQKDDWDFVFNQKLIKY